MSPAGRTSQPQVRYRVTVAEVVDGAATVVMDATGAGFHAAVGELADGPAARRLVFVHRGRACRGDRRAGRRLSQASVTA
jgi:hypothetical protein